MLGAWLGLFEMLTDRVPWPMWLILVLVGGFPVFRKVILAARKRKVIAHTLMSVGVAAAMAVGEWPGLLWGAGRPRERPMADDPGEIRRRIDALQRRLQEVERGELSPQQVQQQMPMMRPMCQGMMGGMGSMPVEREEMSQRRHDQIRRLEERVSQLEGARR